MDENSYLNLLGTRCSTDIKISNSVKYTAADDYFFSTIFSNFFPVGQFSSGQAYFFVFAYFKNSFLL